MDKRGLRNLLGSTSLAFLTACGGGKQQAEVIGVKREYYEALDLASKDDGIRYIFGYAPAEVKAILVMNDKRGWLDDNRRALVNMSDELKDSTSNVAKTYNKLKNDPQSQGAYVVRGVNNDEVFAKDGLKDTLIEPLSGKQCIVKLIDRDLSQLPAKCSDTGNVAITAAVPEKVKEAVAASPVSPEINEETQQMTEPNGDMSRPPVPVDTPVVVSGSSKYISDDFEDSFPEEVAPPKKQIAAPKKESSPQPVVKKAPSGPKPYPDVEETDVFAESDKKTEEVRAPALHKNNSGLMTMEQAEKKINLKKGDYFIVKVEPLSLIWRGHRDPSLNMLGLMQRAKDCVTRPDGSLSSNFVVGKVEAPGKAVFLSEFCASEGQKTAVNAHPELLHLSAP